MRMNQKLKPGKYLCEQGWPGSVSRSNLHDDTPLGLTYNLTYLIVSIEVKSTKKWFIF